MGYNFYMDHILCLSFHLLFQCNNIYYSLSSEMSSSSVLVIESYLMSCVWRPPFNSSPKQTLFQWWYMNFKIIYWQSSGNSIKVLKFHQVFPLGKIHQNPTVSGRGLWFSKCNNKGYQIRSKNWNHFLALE